MSISEPFVAELTQEAATTRRVLERIPADKLAWKPHAKSMSLGQLALHVATVPARVSGLLRENITEPPQFGQPEATSSAELLGAHDESVEAGKAALAGWNDAAMMAEWRFSAGGKTLMAAPRVAMVRAIMFNHLYHHRGQLLVYLRLLNVSVPSVYGPTADENPFA